MKLTDNQIWTIKLARIWSAKSKNRELADNTINDYRKEGSRLLRDFANDPKYAAAVWARAAKTQSKNTWFRRKASLLFVAREETARLLSIQDRLQRVLRKQPTVKVQAEFEATLLALEFFVYLLDPPSKPITPQQRESKRKHIHGLPVNWPYLVASQCPKYALAILAQAVTGCRPAELHSGMIVELNENSLTFEIEGAKVTKFAGQEQRIMSFQVNEKSKPDLRILAQEVARAGGRKSITIDSPKSYGKSFERAAMRAFPGRQKTLSPYCLRHQFAADFKREGHSKEEIAAALGHAATRSQEFYGTAGQGKSGGTGLVSLEASRPVRNITKTPPNQSTGPGM